MTFRDLPPIPVLILLGAFFAHQPTLSLPPHVLAIGPTLTTEIRPSLSTHALLLIHG